MLKFRQINIEYNLTWAELMNCQIHYANEDFLLLSQDKGNIIVIDTQNYNTIQYFQAYGAIIGCVDYHKKTQYLAVGGYSSSINLFKFVDKIFILKIQSEPLHFDKIQSIKFLNEGTQLISISFDEQIYLWNSEEMKVIAIINQLKGKIQDMSISSKILVTITQEGVISTYCLGNLKFLKNRNNVKAKIEEIAGTKVKIMNNSLQVQADDNIKFVIFQQQKIIRKFVSDEYCEYKAIYFQSDNKYLIAISYSNIRVFEIATGIEIYQIQSTLLKSFCQDEQQNFIYSCNLLTFDIHILELNI